jgi:PhnB protein
MTTSSKTTEAQAPVKRIPEGFRSITPYVIVKRAAELIEFVKQAFGATEILRTTGSAGGLHVEVRVGDSMMMIGGGAAMTQETPASLHLYVPDADAVYRRALEAGADSLYEPVDQVYGDREAGVKDPAGNVWYIATHMEGGSAQYIPEGLQTVTPFLHPVGAPQLIDFLKEGLGAEEISRYQSPDGVVRHATVRIGDSMIEMGEAHGEFRQMPPSIYLYVDDVDAIYARAVKAGATSIRPPADQSYGDRNAWIKDPFDNTWFIAAPIKDVES